MVLVGLADISGTGAAVQLATKGNARSVMLAITTGTGIVRVGDSTVSATKGVAVPSLASGNILVLPIGPSPNDVYPLSSIWIYIGNSTTVSPTLVI